MQSAIVLLGLSMTLQSVAASGLVGLAFAAGMIIGTFTLGAVLGRLLRVERPLTTLLSSGTAICGGSAIAATGSVIAASQAHMAVALGCVFILNAIAILVFPTLGNVFELSHQQFGTWAAVAIHDVANVLAAADAYDRQHPVAGSPHAALEVATAVKLTRALWIAPVCIAIAWVYRRRQIKEAKASQDVGEGGGGVRSEPGALSRVPIPWFIGGFVLAVLVATFVPALRDYAPTLVATGRKMMTIALLLIGTTLSLSTIRTMSWRAMVLAVSLWVAITAAALVVVKLTMT